MAEQRPIHVKEAGSRRTYGDADTPEVAYCKKSAGPKTYLLSRGGLCFTYATAMNMGSVLRRHIPWEAVSGMLVRKQTGNNISSTIAERDRERLRASETRRCEKPSTENAQRSL